MNNKDDIKILPEDKIELNQDQKNLIELAVEQQIPPEDAEFLEKIKSNSQNTTDTPNELFGKLSNYFANKYGVEFGMIYLAAIMGGEEKYKEAVHSVENLRANERVLKRDN